MKKILSADDTDRLIQMAWEDRTPFEAIELQFGLNESDVITLMRSTMKRPSFVMWRKRVTGRKTKHKVIRNPEINRFTSSDQKNRQ
ncbi:MAG: TIGR03643 family protein [Arenimonas sp.]